MPLYEARDDSDYSERFDADSMQDAIQKAMRSWREHDWPEVTPEEIAEGQSATVTVLVHVAELDAAGNEVCAEGFTIDV